MPTFATYKKDRYRAYFKYQGKMYVKIVNTKAEGKAWKVEKIKQLKREAAQPPALMFSAVSARYLDDCEARMQPITIQEKYRHLTEFAEFIGHDFPAQELTVSTAKAFIEKTWKDRNKNNKSANRRLGDLQACWNWHKDVLPENPWKSVKPYPEDTVDKYVPPLEHIEAVLDKAEPWERRLLLFLLHTGARIGELYQLTWGDVKFERNAVELWTRKRKGGKLQPRLLPLAPILREMLEEMAKTRIEGAPYVFVNPNTQNRYQRQQPCVRNLLKRLCKAAEVKEFRFHALRHYVAQQLIRHVKGNLVDVQLLLGHQRATTTDIYLKSLSSSIDHMAEYIEDAVLPKKKEEAEPVQ